MGAHLNPGPMRSQHWLQESHEGGRGSPSGQRVTSLGAGHRPRLLRVQRPRPAMAAPVCLALAAREGAVREGFLEKASTQRPIGGMGVRLGRRGPWRGVVPAEGTAGGRHGGTSTQEWVRDEAGAGSWAEELGALSSVSRGVGGGGLAWSVPCSNSPGVPALCRMQRG